MKVVVVGLGYACQGLKLPLHLQWHSWILAQIVLFGFPQHRNMLNLNILARQLEVHSASFLQEYRTQLKYLHEPCFSGRGLVTFYSRKEAALTSRQWQRMIFPWEDCPISWGGHVSNRDNSGNVADAAQGRIHDVCKDHTQDLCGSASNSSCTTKTSLHEPGECLKGVRLALGSSKGLWMSFFTFHISGSV